MYNEIIYLVTKTTETNKVGDSIKKEEKKMRFAKLKSIGQSEFYQAQGQGLKPELKLVLPDILDYEGQEEVIYNNFRYKVLRTFKPDNTNEIEIVCYGGIRLESVQNGDS